MLVKECWYDMDKLQGFYKSWIPYENSYEIEYKDGKKMVNI